MSILKRQNEANNMHKKIYCAYYLYFNSLSISCAEKSFKNYWLQKRKNREEDKKVNDKIEQIAKYVTKYISNRKQ
jgi:hypothetical protein